MIEKKKSDESFISSNTDVKKMKTEFGKSSQITRRKFHKR